MGNVYLITGASSDVGCALIERLYQEGDLFIAQGAGDLKGLADLCKAHPGAIRTYDVDLTNEAALCAVRLCPGAAKAVFASHVSAEPAARAVLQALGKTPLLTAGLRLGEGTGAVACIPLWDMARAVYAESYSFETCGVEAYQPQEGGL